MSAPERVCLSGSDIAKLVRGEAIRAGGKEFVFDGTLETEAVQALEDLKKNLTNDKTHVNVTR